MAYLGENGLSKLWVRMKSYINSKFEDISSFAYPKTGGTIEGDVNIKGDLSLLGDVTFADVEKTREELGLGDVATEDILPQSKGGTGETNVRSLFSATAIVTGTVTVDGGSYKANLTVTGTKEGYYPFGIVGFYVQGTNQPRISFSDVYMSSRAVGSVTITYSLSNWSSSYDYSGTIVFHVLWVKEDNVNTL